THEGNSIIGFHGLVKSALFGKITDLMRFADRTGGAEQEPFAFVGNNNAEQHPQHRGFTCAIRTQYTENTAPLYGQVNSVNRSFAVESFDDIAGLYGISVVVDGEISWDAGRHLRLSCWGAVSSNAALLLMTS